MSWVFFCFFAITPTYNSLHALTHTKSAQAHGYSPTGGSYSSKRASINKQKKKTFSLVFSDPLSSSQQRCGRVVDTNAVRQGLPTRCWWTVCLDSPPAIERWWWPEGSCQSELASAAGANRCECVTVSTSLVELHGNAHVQQLRGVWVCVNVCVCISVS